MQNNNYNVAKLPTDVKARTYKVDHHWSYDWTLDAFYSSQRSDSPSPSGSCSYSTGPSISHAHCWTSNRPGLDPHSSRTRNFAHWPEPNSVYPLDYAEYSTDCARRLLSRRNLLRDCLHPLMFLVLFLALC